MLNIPAMDIQATSEADTEAAAAHLAEQARPGTAILLQGTLGAGKTVFARAYIRALCKNQELDVPSPTFTLVQTYETPLGPLWHFDLYRLEKPGDVLELGWEEALSGDHLVLVEWPERLGPFKPAKAITVQFSAQGPTQRLITVPDATWAVQDPS